MSSFVSSDMIDEYQRNGVTLIPGLFRPHLKHLRLGVERNMFHPGPYAAENLKEGENGRFFDDYCNWNRIPEFKKVVYDKEVCLAAAELMKSNSVQLMIMFWLKNQGLQKKHLGIQMVPIILSKAKKL